MISIQRRGQPAQKSQASKAPTDWSNDRDYENPLESNKPGPPKAPEAPIGPLKASFPVPSAPNIAWYTPKDMDHLLQISLQASKGGSGDNLKAKTSDVYHNRSYMECYNFCQQYKDYFAICGATRLNQIPFVAFFL